MLGAPRSCRVPAPAPVAISVPAGGVAVAGVEIAKDRGARRRHALAGDAVVGAEGEALQEQRGRGRGEGEQPVRGLDRAGAERQRRGNAS